MKSLLNETTVRHSLQIDYCLFEKGQGLNWYQVDPNLKFLVERYTDPVDRPWCEDKLMAFGDLCGGAIAERAEIIDRNPPQLERYDRWGEEINRIVHHPAARETKRDLWEAGYACLRLDGKMPSGRPIPTVALTAMDYLLSQADTGMVCANGMTPGVGLLIERYAEESVKHRFLPHIKTPNYDEAMDGAMFMTEVTGGSDLSSVSTVARYRDGQWYLSGSKWFCSNVDAALITTLARPENAGPGLSAVGLFLVPKTRRDGKANGIHIRRLKDKLGTRSVPTAEVDFEEAEAYLLSGTDPTDKASRGINRMMEMVNLSRLGVAAMGLGIARRSFLEAAIYAAHRNAFGRRIDEFPMVRETLAALLIEVEAATALFFSAAISEREGQRQRLLIPLAKFRGARLGLEAAIQALELHGGNGYIENWPTARLLRDAQCHTVWEGAENIICLDVLRSMAKEQTAEPLCAWVQQVLDDAEAGPLAKPRQALSAAFDEVKTILQALAQSDRTFALTHARRVAQYLADLAKAALLLEEATWELGYHGTARKALVAFLFMEKHFGSLSHRGMDCANPTLVRAFEIITRYGIATPDDIKEFL
ncbi:MAG: acyl-CoA dehydrogenase family protein [Acidobacteria bacterium]|nr:acyl-CoA dehydrogenase family protein [Acidobacteriota bacterium]